MRPEIAYVVLFSLLTVVAGTREEFNVGFWGELMNQRILPYLNLYELKKFTSCNRLVQGVCDSYLEDHDPFITMISPFMDVVDAEVFRELLRDTGAVVSGASALAYFDLHPLRSAELDIYATFDMVIALGVFFLARGYVFVPHGSQHFEFGALAAFRSPEDYLGKGRRGSLASAVVDVFRLFSSNSGQSVRISAFRFSFMHVVLELHSSEFLA
ncbi:hypothetical protein BDZ89DRAFT_1142462 [Hymenopellis radicata]|nr:hypothetical protein BDZ89DRAFT_1142462 [Hymenopellis radicata]